MEIHLMGKIIGLTGLIGTGKSTVAGILRGLNCAVFDADEYVHKLYEDKEVQQKLEAAFSGRSSREAIAEMLHKIPAQKPALEEILHPLVRQAEMDFIAQHKEEEHVVLDIPLLFETEADQLCDVVWVTDCTPETQRKRVLSRVGYNEERLEEILRWQGDGEAKRNRADLVINTENSLETLASGLKEALQKLDA